MGQVLLLLVVALTVAAVVFGVTVLVSGRDPGLTPVEPDGRAVPLPGTRPLHESDVAEVRFDTTWRGYRMAQVDQAMRRAAYDIGYKTELIGVLEAEVAALREGRIEEADALRRTREEAAGTAGAPAGATPSAVDRPAGGTPSAADREAVGRGAADRAAADRGDVDRAAADRGGVDRGGADRLDAEAGVAAAPAAAAVEDETLPATDVPTPAGPLAPVAAPVEPEPTDRPVSLHPPADAVSAAPAPTEPTGQAAASTGQQGASTGQQGASTAGTAGGATDDADVDGDRERGGVVRSESA
ncbi:DivIVA domain-containing protein [Micromonospora viridifaciens]|uniref:DivIVA domain-containing protein n=1 Tax=Micromonospora viridifaciens TaxID=1881 RepID=A0A1C4ZZ46_MICVI|nr:DivIVA domain-containing protein [Micromonospora viridifaciens]